MARDVDPDGERTLAVLTKLDLMDAGTDAIDVLSGRVITESKIIKNFSIHSLVKLGIIGVVNSSQADIIGQKSMKSALQDESIFFKKRYPNLAYRNGTKYLIKTLNQLLMHHINKCLPGLKDRVREGIKEQERQLELYGIQIIDQSQTMLRITNRFSSFFKSAIDGDSINVISGKSLSSGAKISNLFHQTLFTNLQKIDPSTLEDDEILIYISNAAGTKPAMFVPEKAFEIIVKQEIQKFRNPSMYCVDQVQREMDLIVQQCIENVSEFRRFPKIAEKIRRKTRAFVEERAQIAKNEIEKLMSYELAYINTKHQDIRDKELLLAFQNSTLSETNSIGTRKERDCNLIKKMVKEYFGIIRTKMQDSIPKLIMQSLVTHVLENLASRIHYLFEQREKYDELFTEHEDLRMRRMAAEQRLNAFNKAKKEIADVEDFLIE